jgi:hypothetical protein
MVMRALAPKETLWLDDGYAYRAAWEYRVDSLLVDVSRVLAEGRLSPLVSRCPFPLRDEPLLARIFGTPTAARSTLVDQIILGTVHPLRDYLPNDSCEASLG